MTDFRDMSIPQRLDLIEEIWESIAIDAEHLVLSESQKRQIEERLDAFYINPEPGQPVSETLETLRDRL